MQENENGYQVGGISYLMHQYGPIPFTNMQCNWELGVASTIDSLPRSLKMFILAVSVTDAYTNCGIVSIVVAQLATTGNGQ